MAYVLTLFYFLLVVPVFCDESQEELCPSKTLTWSALRTSLASDGSVLPGATTTPFCTEQPCQVPVCRLTETEEKVEKLCCPPEPEHRDGKKCAKMEQQRPIESRAPFCCKMYFCESRGNGSESKVFNLTEEDLDYPSYRSYSLYQETLAPGAYYNLSYFGKNKRCKDLGFALPQNCKLENDDEMIPQEGGCNYKCEVPLTREIVVQNVKVESYCSFKHKGITYTSGQRLKLGKCEYWHCTNETLYLHTCVADITKIQVPDNCRVVKPSQSNFTYPKCCLQLLCKTWYPWEFGFKFSEYIRTFQ